MAKDPAFLFYTQDFLVGTMFMTNAEVGIYIRLLCIQHQNQYIDKQIFSEKTKGHKNIAKKFLECEKGYYNERLFDEMQKRKQKSNIYRKNVQKRWNKNDTNEIQNGYNCITTVIQSENENVNEINNSNSKEYNINKRKDISNDNNIKDNNIDQLLELWIRTLGRNPKHTEVEETEKLINKFSFSKVEKAFREASLRNIKSLRYLIDNLDSSGNLLSYKEKNNNEEEEIPKQPDLG